MILSVYCHTKATQGGSKEKYAKLEGPIPNDIPVVDNFFVFWGIPKAYHTMIYGIRCL